MLGCRNTCSSQQIIRRMTLTPLRREKKKMIALLSPTPFLHLFFFAIVIFFFLFRGARELGSH